MLNKNSRGRVRCPRCGILRAALAGRWCDDCERQGELPFVGDLTGYPAPSIEPLVAPSAMVPEAFSRPAGSRDGLETATGDTNDDGAPNTEGVAYGASLRVGGEVVWRCNHLHRTTEGALACASRERARREQEAATTATAPSAA
jgi:hypothetical protein